MKRLGEREGVQRAREERGKDSEWRESREKDRQEERERDPLLFC